MKNKQHHKYIIAIIYFFILLLSACKQQSIHSHQHEHKDTHNEHHPEEEEEESEQHHEEDNIVTLSSEAIARSGIKVSKVEQGSIGQSIDIAAEIEFNPDKVAHVTPLVSGHLLSVNVSTGEFVKADQALARLRSVQLGQARADLSRTTSLLNAATRNLARQKKLREEKINSEKSLLEAQASYEQAQAERQAAAAQLKVFGVTGGVGPDMTLKSPIDGVIIERHATRGENISPDDTLFIVANLSKIWVIGRVYERKIGRIREGMKATLTLSAYPNRSWVGKIDYIASKIDEATRSLPIRVEIDNPDGLLKPGLYGSLHIEEELEPTDSKVVLLPNSAIQTLNNQTIVFTPHGQNSFKAQPVTLGLQGRYHSEVIQGVTTETRVVTQGAFILKSELVRGSLGHGHAH